jgi:aminopeptidase N
MTLEHRHHARCACGSSLSSYASAPRPFVLSGTKRVYERPRPFTIRHIALDLALDVEQKAIEGSATLDIVRVDARATELALDAVGFDLRAVEVSASEGAWSKSEVVYDGETVRVSIPESLATGKVRINYRAVPKRGLYFLAPDEHVRDRPRQVWTQCQDEDARHVFPCHDKPHIKQSTELRVKVPTGWSALSNGERMATSEAEARGEFHFRFDEPHPSYLFTLVAGEFARIDAEAKAGDRTVPLAYLVPKGREEDGRRTFARTPEMIEHMSRTIGVPYPWARYSQVVVSDFIFGGMENTTATTMYEHILLDERAAIDVTSDDLIAHELAHQWFGDLVTCRDWSHGWLNEGFATFMEHIDREHRLGRDEYDYGVKGDAETYFGEARGRYRRPIVCQDYEAPIDIFDRHLYEKGACVLHMLRRELGDGPFWSGVRKYLETHAKGVVETRDLHRALEASSGRSLDRFFEQWVFRAGHPELDIKIEHDGGFATITVKQTQSPAHGESTSAPFGFDITFDIALAEGRVERHVRRVDQLTHSFVLACPKRPLYIVIDPEQAVIAEVRLEAPADMLRNQLASAPTARGRMLAAPSLSKLDDPATNDALERVLAKEDEFWGVRAEAAEALGGIRSEAAFKVLAAHATTKHPKVRRAVVHALSRFRTAKAVEVLRPLALKDESYVVEAEAARSLGGTRQAAAFDVLIDIIDRPAWADVIRAGALDGLADLRDERAVPHVLARTRYGVSTRGRRAAILALPKLSSERRTREALEDLLDQADPYLRVDVVRAIADLGDPKSRGALHRRLDRELDGRVRRRIREVLRDLGTAGKRDTDRLRDELETLRAEHAELRARLGKLEASLGSKAAPDAAAKDSERPKARSEKHKKRGKA